VIFPIFREILKNFSLYMGKNFPIFKEKNWEKLEFSFIFRKNFPGWGIFSPYLGNFVGNFSQIGKYFPTYREKKSGKSFLIYDFAPDPFLIY